MGHGQARLSERLAIEVLELVEVGLAVRIKDVFVEELLKLPRREGPIVERHMQEEILPLGRSNSFFYLSFVPQSD